MSALLSDTDLNDFISPGIACVKPAGPTEAKDNNNKLEVGIESNVPVKVSITLQDCLACAGCITSSEEILLSKQSHTVFLKKWNELKQEGSRSLVVSISPQCRLSMASYYSMNLGDFDHCFRHILKDKFNAKYVVGTQIGRSISIAQMNKTMQSKSTEKVGPMICSVCPGFVLYAEKTKPELVPHMLDIKSPQQITGNLLKQIDPTCYHLSIMPCFDKKLEASRDECLKEVDCVITPKEFVTMLNELSIDFSSYLSGPDLIKELTPTSWSPELHWLSNEGSSSGGYAYQYILDLQSKNVRSHIVTVDGKNSDVVEYRLISEVGQVIASAGQVYGFRNIQNMVRKLSQGSASKKRGIKVKRRSRPTGKDPTSSIAVADPTKTDFIEVMACPSGCINGGGLLNDGENANRRKLLAQDLSQEYAKIPIVKNIQDVADTYSSKTSDLRYNLQVLESASSDFVTIGNTW